VIRSDMFVIKSHIVVTILAENQKNCPQAR
jgi:hypothetical protein